MARTQGEFREEVKEAERQIFGLMRSYVEYLTSYIPTIDLTIEQLQNYAYYGLKERMESIPYPHSRKGVRGDIAFFRKLARSEVLTPSFDGLSPEQISLLTSDDDHPEMFPIKMFSAVEWADMQDELPVLAKRGMDYRDAKRYYLLRSVLNLFVKTAAGILKDDPHESNYRGKWRVADMQSREQISQVRYTILHNLSGGD